MKTEQSEGSQYPLSKSLFYLRLLMITQPCKSAFWINWNACNRLNNILVPSALKISWTTCNAFQTCQSSCIHQLVFLSLPPRSACSSSYPSLSRSPVSPYLKFWSRSLNCAASALWHKLQKDLRHFEHPTILSVNLSTPLLALPSVTFYSRLKTELLKPSNPASSRNHNHQPFPP